MKELYIKERTMSSKQIAELLNEGKPKDEHIRHDSIKRTMERLQDREVIKLTPMVEVNHLGQNVEVYHVNEDHSYIVVAQLSPEFTAALVKEWRRLKGENEDLKELVAEQGRKIDMLCEKIAALPAGVSLPAETMTVSYQATGMVGRGSLGKRDVLQIKELHSQGLRNMEISRICGWHMNTVYRVIKGERDYLLVDWSTNNQSQG